ncbi:hypothetical protein C8R45DRAFT_1088738 [Mycena sanguinolenta]|nr:hypothetical protein C8R45DRAFT_1088738 [Mycena sanguinolenta]
MFDSQEIDEARVNLIEALYRSQGDSGFMFREFINPGAHIPQPLKVSEEGEPTKMIPIEAVPDSNPYCEPKDFELTVNALSATDLVDYTIEFVPDEVPQPEADDAFSDSEVQEPVPPKRARKAKGLAKGPKGRAKAKGKGKAKMVEPETEPEQPTNDKGKAKAVEEEAEPAPKPATRGRKATASAPSKARPPAPAPTRPRSARIAAAKAGSSTQPAVPSQTSPSPSTDPSPDAAQPPAPAPPAVEPSATTPPSPGASSAPPPAESSAAAPLTINRDLSRFPPDILTRRTQRIDPDTGIFLDAWGDTPSPPATRPTAGPSRLPDGPRDKQVGQKRGRPAELAAQEPPQQKRSPFFQPPGPPKRPPGKHVKRVVINGIVYTKTKPSKK